MDYESIYKESAAEFTLKNQGNTFSIIHLYE